MGCDIHAFAEIRTAGGWQLIHQPIPDTTFPDDEDEVFPDHRDYGLFGFLADVRNLSRVPTLVPRRGLPDDISDEMREKHAGAEGDAHSETWYTLAELLDQDYGRVFEDRRAMTQLPGGGWTGAGLAAEGEGKVTSLRDFLGTDYFARLDELAMFADDPADIRIVLWFDN